MKKIISSLALFSFLLAEPSAFMAGDLDSNSPYGLTKDEKYIWKNKNSIKQLNNLISKQKQTIHQQEKEIQNLKLLILNINNNMENLTQKLNGVQSILSSVDSIYIQIPNLKKEINQNKQNLLNLNNSFNKKIESLKNSINNNFNNLKNIVNKNKSTNDENTKIVIGLVENLAQNLEKIRSELKNQEKKLDFRTWKKQVILEKAISDFRHSEFEKSKQMFLFLYNIKYNIGKVSFYLAEMKYKKVQYKKALEYYKKAIKNSKKSDYYMDDLLYHTGYSLEKLGHIKSAKNSYLKLINDYPKSLFVKYAEKRLENLEKKK